MSAKDVVARLISGSSVNSNTDFGQEFSLSLIDCGPFCHKVAVLNSPGRRPREIRSAGLLSERTCCHSQFFIVLVISIMSETRFLTNVFNELRGVLIQCSAMVESDHKIVFSNFKCFKAWDVASCNCARRRAADSSSRGNDIVLRGATLDFEQTKCVSLFPSDDEDRT